LVFGGIYFFKAPPSTAKIAPAETSGGATLEERKSRPDTPENNAKTPDTALTATHGKQKPAAKNN
jgi:hypothetical protein